jgi:hypothetical protein
MILKQKAKELHDQGFSVIPTKLNKAPMQAGWQQMIDDRRIEPNGSFAAAAGVGVVLGAKMGNKYLAAIDVDCYEKGISKAMCAYISDLCGKAISFRVGEAPKFLVPYLAPEQVRKRFSDEYKYTEKKNHRIERLGSGQQFVAYGEQEAGEYRWYNGELDADPLPVLDELAIDSIMAKFAELAQEAGLEPVKKPLSRPKPSSQPMGRMNSDERYNELRDALSYLNPDMDYDHWLKVGMAMYGLAGGFGLWNQWSSGGNKYDPSIMERKWNSFEGTDINPETVFWMAQQAGWTNPRAIESAANDFHALPGIEKDTWSRWVFIMRHNEVVNMISGERRPVNAFNTSMKPVVPLPAKGAKPSAIDYLLGQCKGIAVLDAIYDPQQPEIFDVKGEKYLNSFREDSMPDIAPDWEGRDAARIVSKHIGDNWGRDAWHLIQWMAHNVQHPGVKICWSPILYGVQGDGKSIALDVLRAAMGQQNVNTADNSEIQSQFNEWACGACVVGVEELRVKGHNRHEILNALKPLVTNERVRIIGKGRAGYEIRNVTNFVACTNFGDALPLESGDRRWAVFKTRFDTREQMLKERSDDYWNALWGAVKTGGGELRGWLASIDLGGFDRINPPDTAGKEQMILEAETSEKHSVRLAVEDLNDAFSISQIKDYLRSNHERALSNKMVSIYLRELQCIFYGHVKIDGSAVRVWGKKDGLSNDEIRKAVRKNDADQHGF